MSEGEPTQEFKERFRKDLADTEAWLATLDGELLEVALPDQVWGMVTKMADEYGSTPTKVFCVGIYRFLRSQGKLRQKP